LNGHWSDNSFTPGFAIVLLRALRFGLLTVGLALLALGPAAPARAYVVSGSKWPQPGGLGSPITLTYSFQNIFDGGLKMPDGQPLPNNLIRNSIEDAMRVWASVAPINYIEVPDNGLAYGIAGATYGQIRFRHIFINGPDPPPPALPVAKAQAYFPGSGVSAGDVEYDDGDRWQEVGTLPIPDILGATIHELGHTLGLNHTDLVDANMYWIFTRYSGPGTGMLFPDDVAGVQAIYGAGRGSVTSLVPEPATFMLAALGAGILGYRRRNGIRRR
jgi:Matrixin/PEP-CTERM motif